MGTSYIWYIDLQFFEFILLVADCRQVDSKTPCHGYSLYHNELNVVMKIRMKNTIVFAQILVYFGRINNMKIRLQVVHGFEYCILGGKRHMQVWKNF